eukprot:TRINITY_DN7302_c0_g1_i1.p1 TRINITY_DN7302_c0_g1~~TRINITY_DN7302_c0_g1_i1.p1  ORF type:complete len:159 (-),score=23.35 TRINITY_DN7302_c0_g1_i1:47-523(-)
MLSERAYSFLGGSGRNSWIIIAQPVYCLWIFACASLSRRLASSASILTASSNPSGNLTSCSFASQSRGGSPPFPGTSLGSESNSSNSSLFARISAIIYLIQTNTAAEKRIDDDGKRTALVVWKTDDFWASFLWRWLLQACKLQRTSLGVNVPLFRHIE